MSGRTSEKSAFSSKLEALSSTNEQLQKTNKELRRAEKESREAATRLLEELLAEELGGVDLSDISEVGSDYDKRFLRLANILLGNPAADAHACSPELEQPTLEPRARTSNEDSSTRRPYSEKTGVYTDWDSDALNELATAGTVAGRKLSLEDGGSFSVALQPVQLDSGARAMLYSPTTGIHQAAELKELKDGPHCLADIVEAASRSLTLDQLAQSGAIGYTSATTATKTCLESTGFFWLDITEPTPDEMDSLARAFGIHPLTIEDILTDAGDRDKMESISDYTFLIYRAVDTGTSEEAPRSDGIEATGFSIIIKPSCILTFHSECSTSHVANTLAKLQEISTISQLSAIASPVYVAYALVDNITDSLVPMMRALEVEVDAVDELILVLSQKERSDMLQRIGAVRRRILGIWRLLLGKPDVLRLFSRLMVQVLMAEEMGKAAVEGDDQPKADADTVTMEGIEHYLSDVHDHLVAMISSCSHCEMVLARSHSNYMAQISLELGEATVDTGVFSNRWLVIAAILLPIQFVTGLFGQNVKVPWKPDSDTGAYDDTKAFFGIFGCCMAYVVIVSTWAWYKKIF